MKYENNPRLASWLAKGFPFVAVEAEFVLDDQEFQKHLAELQLQDCPADEIKDRAAYRTLTHNQPVAPKQLAAAPKPDNSNIAEQLERIDEHVEAIYETELKRVEYEVERDRHNRRGELVQAIFQALVFLFLLFMIFAVRGHAQVANVTPAIVVSVCGTPPANWPATGRAPLTVDANGNLCTPSGSGGTSSNFGAASPSAGTAAGARDTNGNMQPLSLDAPGNAANLNVNCQAGCTAAGDKVGNSKVVGAGNDATSVALAGANGAVVNITAGSSPLMTIVPEVSPDGGTTWYSAVFLDPVTGAMSTSVVNPANGQYQLAWIGAETNARVRASAYTSGAITMQIRGTVTRPFSIMYGSDGTNIRPIATTTTGLTKVDLSGTGANSNKLLVTPDSVALPSHQSTNVDQWNGTTTDTNSGTKSAGTLRVVIATDQPALTNALKVDGSAVTQPVSGTFWQATQPISAAALPLPSGASTSAKQPALGTAGSASSDVITIQGIASMTAVKVDGSAVTQPVSGTFWQATQPVSGTVTANAGSGTFNIQSNASVNEAQVGGTAVVANPCATAIPTQVAISQTASTKVISATSAKKNYICSIVLIAGAAEIPSVVEGTGSTCGTSTAAVAGSTTTANGMSLAANGGFAAIGGASAALSGIGTNVDTCLFQNGSNRLSGWLTYVQQ